MKKWQIIRKTAPLAMSFACLASGLIWGEARSTIFSMAQLIISAKSMKK
jgi:hypothetical protein